MQEKKIETQVVDNKLKTIITTITTNVVENSVDLDFLYSQKQSILNQKEQQKLAYELQMTTRDTEIAEIDGMIAECIKSGLKTAQEIAEENKLNNEQVIN